MLIVSRGKKAKEIDWVVIFWSGGKERMEEVGDHF